MYRLEGWKNPCYNQSKERPASATYSAFEAGADAMLGGILRLLDNEQLVPPRVAEDIKLFMEISEEGE